jgi:hypothetical protein
LLLVSRAQVKGYPTIFYFKDGKKQFAYEGGRKEQVCVFSSAPLLGYRSCVVCVCVCVCRIRQSVLFEFNLLDRGVVVFGSTVVPLAASFSLCEEDPTNALGRVFAFAWLLLGLMIACLITFVIRPGDGFLCGGPAPIFLTLSSLTSLRVGLH